MNRLALDRRRFLKLVGASALTYPFLRGVPSYAAGTNPIYLVLLFTANGCVRYRWGAQGAPPTSTAVTATGVTNGPLTFRPTLQAFANAGPNGDAGTTDLTKYVTVLDGLFNKAAIGGTHETGMSALWTGLLPGVGSQKSPGPSIDQVIAGQLNATTPYSSIAMVVQSSADFSQQRSVDNRMIYDVNGNWIDPIATTPADTVSKLFGMVMGSSSSSGPNKTLFIRQQVWNHVNADLTALQSRLCTEDRQQLQNLQALWNTVLNQLQAAAAQAAMCTKPSAGAAAGDGGAGGPDPFPQYAQVMPNILAMTLACNLTQVASLQYSQALSPVAFTWLGPTQNQTHHIFSHQTPASLNQLFSSMEPLPANADLYTEDSNVASLYPQQLLDIESWYAQQIASLAYTFSNTMVGGGKSLLDQSLICWGSEIDMGAAHNHDDTPFVLIGGAGGKLKSTTVGGQLVRFPLNLAGYSQQNNQTGIRCHNDLLMTLANIMGVTADQVQTGYGANWSGFSSYYNSPITDILA